MLADRLIATLPASSETLYNPWTSICDWDTRFNTPEAKRLRLAQHLDCNARLMLIGEAPGYQGCRYSGVAFTSERLLLEGGIPRVTAPDQRLTARSLPFSEPSATIVWKCLYKLGIQDSTILWNAVQLHPHRPGLPHTNRTPTPAELALGQPALELLLDGFPKTRIIAVGKKAEAILEQMGIKPFACVRHPANGGAQLFSSGLELAIQA